MKATPDHYARLIVARSCRLGTEGHIHLLSTLREPMTSAQIVALLGVNLNTIIKTLRAMHRHGLVQRVGWIRPVAHSRWVPVWQFDGVDVPCPVPEKPSVAKVRSALVLIGSVAEILREEPRTVTDLAEELAMHKESGARLVGMLRKHGMSYIASWTRAESGLPVAQHAFGPGVDAKRPPREDLRKQAKRHRARHAAKKRHLALIQATAGHAHDDMRRAA